MTFRPNIDFRWPKVHRKMYNGLDIDPEPAWKIILKMTGHALIRVDLPTSIKHDLNGFQFGQKTKRDKRRLWKTDVAMAVAISKES